MYKRNIHYIIVEKNYALVKFFEKPSKYIYLRSILRNQLKDYAHKFFVIKSPSITEKEFEDYLKSLSLECFLEERKGNKATLRVNNPF